MFCYKDVFIITHLCVEVTTVCAAGIFAHGAIVLLNTMTTATRIKESV